MTTHIPAPVLRSPDHLLAAIPFLLGFRPAASVVVIWIHSGDITLTQRVDWPEKEAALDLTHWAQAVVRAARHVTAQGAVLVGYPPAPTSALAGDCGGPLVSLGEGIDQTKTELLDSMLVLDDGWLRVLGEPGAGEGQLRPFDLQITADVSDDFLYSGWSFATSREEVCAEFASVESAPSSTHDEEQLLHEHFNDIDPASIEVWREDLIHRLLNCLESGTVEPEGNGLFVTGLRDIRVRDSVLWHLAQQLDPSTSLIALRTVVRALPTGHRAPTATVAAICAWLLGDGVRASAAVDIALSEEPDYGLAQLVSTALVNGLPPRMWRETMEQLTYDACRNGLN
ncbi:MAG TPA: hypothetical protein DDY88_08730 [Actinobacteria bacterium]|nr:hypothetical protein [Actinomycetota bacterium]